MEVLLLMGGMLLIIIVAVIIIFHFEFLTFFIVVLNNSNSMSPKFEIILLFQQFNEVFYRIIGLFFYKELGIITMNFNITMNTIFL